MLKKKINVNKLVDTYWDNYLLKYDHAAELNFILAEVSLNLYRRKIQVQGIGNLCTHICFIYTK